MPILLLISVFIIATCGLIYELIAGTLASYILGDSIKQFSTIIGCYLFSMGIGSWLSKYIQRHLISFFIKIELLVGAVGGSSAALLFLLFEKVASFSILLYFIVGIIGILVGIEIPLLMRILQDRYEFKDLIARVFTFDYVGALFASVLFPLILVPYLGLIKSSFLFGMLNTTVALGLLCVFKQEIPHVHLHKISAFFILALLGCGLWNAERIMTISEASSYQGHVIYSQSTPYQRIVITKQANDLRLFLNGNLQFSTIDEYRYHEALVHPIMAALKNPKNILVLGGGDGIAVRELLKYPSIENITLVDLDPAMTALFSNSVLLTAINQKALQSPKIHIINLDALIWLKNQINKPHVLYDAIIMDLPDPSNFSIGKLYSLSFFKRLQAVMHKDTLVVVQSTSPLIARKAYWCVVHTLTAAGFFATPYHAYVPSFGDWGYVIASSHPYKIPALFPENLRFIHSKTINTLFEFPLDMAEIPTKVQRLDDQVLVRYFDEEWSRYLIY